MPSVEHPVAADPVEVAGRLRMSAFRLTRLLRQQDDGGLAPTLSAALATIEREGPLTLGDLATREHVAPPSITKVVDKLEAKGLVAHAPAEHDRRVTLVATTSAGRRRITQNRRLRTAWLAARLATLSPTDLAQLDAAADVLDRLVTPVDGDGRVRARASLAIRTTFRALRNRNFRLFFAGQLISQAGTWLTTIALTLLVLSLTHSGVAIGLLTAAQFGPILLFGAWGGLVADRSDKRKLLIITQTLEMFQSFALAALAFMSNPPIAAFYVTALAGGFMLAFDNPARRSFVAEMVEERDVQNAVTLNTALMTCSRVIGPALAGVLVVTTGFGWCFLIDGISYLAVIASLFMMRRSELRQPPVVARAHGQLRAAVTYIRAEPDLWIPLTMMTVVGALTFNFAVVIPLFVENTLHGSNESFTLLYSVLSIGSLAGALIASHMRVIDTRHVAWAAIGFGAAMAVLATAPTLGAAFPFAVLVGLTSVAFITTATATVQVRADPAMRGRVLALQAMLLIGTTPIGGPLLGWFCDAYGARAGILLGAVAALAAGAWGFFAVRHIGARAAIEPTQLTPV